jgi:Icc-related predicted phosphoesterase
VNLGQLRSKSGSFDVIGDTQRTTLIERMLLFREQNDVQRIKLVRALLTDSPDFLVHLGDMVHKGSSKAAWDDFDALVAPIRSAEIRMLPALGNHDYASNTQKAKAYLHARFAWLVSQSWYCAEYENLGLIWLNSNRRALTGRDWEKQNSWYAKTLNEYEKTPHIRGVIVFSHHPPFTNSKMSRDSKTVQKFFLPPFSQDSKTCLLISGHVHSYERFEQSGKQFIVAGGGGGPRVKLYRGKSRRHVDSVLEPSPRPFHYLRITPSDSELHLDVRCLSTESSAHLDQLKLPFSRTEVEE